MSVAKRTGGQRAYPVKGGAYLAGNVAVFLAAGLAVPFASASATDVFAGVSHIGVDNCQGVDGAERIAVDAREHKFRNQGDITFAHVGKDAFFVDENTLTLDSATNTRPKGGVITQVDDDGVWISSGLK